VEVEVSDGHVASDKDSVFTNHVVLYLDFLGVSDAASAWKEDRAASLIELLKVIAASRAPFDIEGESLPDGGYKLRVTPETSTFSDHVVATWPVVDDWPLSKELLMDMYLKLSQDKVSQIAAQALRIGLLVRGGLTMGPLYHADGVVFGEAMVDAYRLESRVSIVPRVAVSSRIYSNVPVCNRKRLIQDADGIWHLNYFANMLVNVPLADRGEWIDSCAKMIDRNIAHFENAEQWNQFAKWSWFSDRFVAVAMP
jgi:hypothetical protein